MDVVEQDNEKEKEQLTTWKTYVRKEQEICDDSYRLSKAGCPGPTTGQYLSV
jgi:hypothetical protein